MNAIETDGGIRENKCTNLQTKFKVNGEIKCKVLYQPVPVPKCLVRHLSLKIKHKCLAICTGTGTGW